MSQVEKHNIIIRPGAKWDLTLWYKNDDGSAIDLTGYTVFCDIRTGPGGELLAQPDIVVTAVQGQVNLSLPPAETIVMGASSGTYDVLVGQNSDHTNIVYIIGGEAIIEPLTTQVVWP